MKPTLVLLLGSLLVYAPRGSGQMLSSTVRRVGKLQEVFAWTQLTYDINGQILLSDRFGEVEETEDADDTRVKRQASSLDGQPRMHPGGPIWQNQNPARPIRQSQHPANESGQFFIQYNNVPMGVERVGNRLFVTVPRRRYGIPATLNYIDLRSDTRTRSPALRPYPGLRARTSLISVYRTRADACGRLWMVDTGLLEIPNNRRQVQPPAIVVYDLRTNRQILRYPFKSTDLVTANTPAGLASITVDVTPDTCGDAFAYVPDLATYGLIVYSLRENDSWRVTHNYYSFDPTQGNLNIAGQRFQWNDGIFSMALSPPARDGCREAYFHPMASTREFSVSTCVLKNRTASSSSDYWTRYNDLGHRGENSQSTTHDVHQRSGIVFFAEVMRSAVSCWNPKRSLSPSNVAILAQDTTLLSYPSDLHVTGDEVWVMANTLPRFIYSRLDTTQYNFFIYRATAADLISGSVCA